MIINIQNPVPILQQHISTNTLIPAENKSQTTILNINKITKNNNDINQKISSYFINLFDDFYKKPNDKPWSEYIIEITSKKNRYFLFFILIAIYILMKLI
jgi:hypothetical protein